MTRVVGHFDLDYFYAQVEEVLNPDFRGLPVVVCVYSGRTEDSGVVSTANYKAREFGVKSGIPIALAKNRLKNIDAKFIPMQHSKYEEYSERIIALLREKTDVVEQTGIDEAFFDITSMVGGDFALAKELASGIKKAVLDGEKLTSSIGLGPNKVVAKLASDFQKPDGLTVVTPQQVKGFMDPLPIGRLNGIGAKSAALLTNKGIITIGDLAKAESSLLESTFGHKFALYLHNAANGIDEDEVAERGKTTQMSRIITLKTNSRNVDEILPQLDPALEDLGRKVSERKLFFRTISVIGVLTNLSTRTRTKTLERPTAETSTIRENAPLLLSSLVTETGELRRVGIRIADLTEAKDQSSLAEFLR